MPFAASAEEVDMGEKVSKLERYWICPTFRRELAVLSHDSRGMRAILFGYRKEIRAVIIVAYSFRYVIDKLTRSRIIPSRTF